MFAIEFHSGKNVRQHSYYPSKDKVRACLDQGNGLHTIQMKEIQSSVSLLSPIKPL